ncbi:MAG: Septum formation protein Maf [Rhodanobacteraceae bacterium]|nr:MAG: Septum formation protein Maf [Rhodanobacteraceae bacterium]
MGERETNHGYACAMLWLASQSPRRRELLAQIGVAFEIIDVDVPEVRGVGESPQAYVERVAREKARAGLAIVVDRDADAVVLGADTEVVLDDRVFGKPREAAEAAAMLRALSGRRHEVVSVVRCMSAQGEHAATCTSAVTFAELDDAAIERYVATGEPFGKAGAYAIQGRAAAFIAHLSGSYSGVMGLPLFETVRLLRAAGVWIDRA